ncbi:RICIN domain-containing protein [Streptomyces fodineus]|uniref:RICIN domain-containing protein n=1 Tax=Streptomyces fodineus TaxID=1904616 RepID=UPI00131D0FC7|nr:ricin-type beta-trefoil lectin domain protein [Streptomyces fodineus]
MGQRNRALAVRRESMKAAKRLIPVLAAIGLAVAGTLTSPPAFAAAPLLRSNLNGRCADIFGFHQENGSSTVTWDCTGNTNQQWFWDGEQIRSSMNGKCLEIYAFNQGDLGSVSMWDCDGGINQRWFRNGNEIRSRMNGKCLDILGGRPEPGQLLVSWSCNGAQSQSWDF